ncbi:alanine racemase [Sulfitobacter sp. HNIBRBA3233]|uniref:alanine racemase n=1 Tax=Sulfitobacter marinivivus TaxID=3158558 RepID=UPI0032DEFBA1
MTNPRIEVDLGKIRHNSRTAVGLLKARGVRVSAVTKAVRGHPAIARAMLDGGAAGLADARLSNVKRLRRAGLVCPITLIRTPMLSQVDDVVRVCEASYNTQAALVVALAAAAIRQDTVHGIILMVEMGDHREGIMPQDLADMAQLVVDTPGVTLRGIGANFACLGGIAPTPAKMQALSILAQGVEKQTGRALQTVSGGNSANLPLAVGNRSFGRINDLRLGEAILLGVDPLSGDQIAGMFTDAFTLVAEVIETDAEPACPPVSFADPVLAGIRLLPNTSPITRLVLALGHQDTDATGLTMPARSSFVGATSDHLVVGTKDKTYRAGSELRFQMTYAALMRAMAAPDIQIDLRNDRPTPGVRETHGQGKRPALEQICSSATPEIPIRRLPIGKAHENKPVQSAGCQTGNAARQDIPHRQGHGRGRS